jgi:hypothetical protein
MKTVVLQKKSLVEDLERTAVEQNTSAEALLDQAVSQFLYQIALKKMETEQATFENIHAQLLVKYPGQYVAIHNGQLIDHDVELRVLHTRVRRKYGRMPILFRQVTSDKNPPDFYFRSPRLRINQ